jgi:AraC-like DNA-binding protein
MPDIELTGLARIPLLILQRAEELGLDRAQLMSAAGIEEGSLRDPDSRVPVRRIFLLWRACLERCSDPTVGLRMGSGTALRDVGLVGYAMANRRTLRGALECLSRYSRILTEVFQCSLRGEEDRVPVLLDGHPLLDALRAPVDSRLSLVLRAARELVGEDLAPVETRFPYAEPAETSGHRRLFRSDLSFGRPSAALVFRRGDLERPVRTADETLGGYLIELAEGILASMSEERSFAQRVERALWTDLSAGRPGLARTARRLGISVRTLQRRLAEEKTSFGALLEGLRRRMARTLLEDPSLAVYEVSFLLGYSDPSTFHRAFRRWNDLSPHEYRRQAG